MIDTVQLAQDEPLPQAWELLKGGFRYQIGKFGAHKWINNETDCNLTWAEIPFQKGKYRLYAEASLPKLHHGNNVEELNAETLDESLTLFEIGVSDVIGRKFDARKATVTRVDYCRNPKLKDNRQVAIWNNALRDRSVSRFKTLPYDFNGVYFRNKGKKLTRQTCCYSKFLEATTNNEPDEIKKSAIGIYRIEPRFRSPISIEAFAKRFGFDGTSGKTLLTPAASTVAINETAKMLGLNKPLVNASTREARLIDIFGINKAFTISGYLEMRERYGRDFLEAEMKKATFYRYEKMIKESGILSVTERAELPPLIATD